MYKHMLIKGVRAVSSNDGKNTRMTIFGVGIEGEELYISAFANARNPEKASYSSPMHLLVALAKAPARYAEYISAVQNGHAEVAEQLRDEFFALCRKSASNFAAAVAAKKWESMQKIAAATSALLQGRVFYIAWEQQGDSNFEVPAKHAMAVLPSHYDSVDREAMFGQKTIAEHIHDFENRDFYDWEAQFADAQTAVIEVGADPEFAAGFEMLLQRAAETPGEATSLDGDEAPAPQQPQRPAQRQPAAAQRAPQPRPAAGQRPPVATTRAATAARPQQPAARPQQPAARPAAGARPATQGAPRPAAKPAPAARPARTAPPRPTVQTPVETEEDPALESDFYAEDQGGEVDAGAETPYEEEMVYGDEGAEAAPAPNTNGAAPGRQRGRPGNRPF